MADRESEGVAMSRIAWFCLSAIAMVALASTATAQVKIGVVLMHGTDSMPPGIGGVDGALRGAGYLVETPEMCWSKRRKHDRTYLDCLKDVDAAVARLKARGAAAIVVGGQSMGGNAAIAYGARRDVKGVIALGPPPIAGATNPQVVSSVQLAQRLIAEGKGGSSQTFMFSNDTGPFALQVTPNVVVSFYAADSPAHMPTNAARLKAPLLVVVGDRDPTGSLARTLAFDRAAPNPLNKFATVSGDHRSAPAAARDVVLSWVKQLTVR
jgi:dienelactone hydrolase